LHKPSVERLEGGDALPINQLLLYSFKRLAEDCEDMDVGSMDMLVSYIEDDDDFVPGTYVPELHLIVRRVDD
jgi:hypothetical protein